jgi:hypothetical protein
VLSAVKIGKSQAVGRASSYCSAHCRKFFFKMETL